MLVVDDQRPRASRPPGLDQRGGALWRSYYRHRVASLPTNLPVPVERLEAPILPADVRRATPWRDVARPSLIKELGDREVELLVRFGLGIVSGPLLDTPRLGVWSFHFADPAHIRGGPPGFWELCAGIPTQTVLLQRLTEVLDGGCEIGRTTLRVSTTSYARRLEQMQFGASRLLSDQLVLASEGAVTEGRPRDPAGLGLVRSAPGDLQACGTLIRCLLRNLRGPRARP